MLRVVPQTRDYSLVYRLVGVAAFTVLTAICAKITVPLEPVPFTMQTFAVLLTGMVLGARDGALSQATYVALVVAGLPLDARGLGSVALFGPTGGYLFGFIVSAAVVGWLVERRDTAMWQRWLAGVVGVVIIYLFGVPVLALVRQMDLSAAIQAGTAPFIIPDLAKMVLAASMTEGGRALLMRQGMPNQS
jgi:biotin transport system substrate-specific component